MSNKETGIATVHVHPCTDNRSVVNPCKQSHDIEVSFTGKFRVAGVTDADCLLGRGQLCQFSSALAAEDMPAQKQEQLIPLGATWHRVGINLPTVSTMMLCVCVCVCVCV